MELFQFDDQEFLSLTEREKEIVTALAESHGRFVQDNLERLCQENGIDLDDPGVTFDCHNPDENPLQFIYTLRLNGTLIGTFGAELDITGGSAK